MLMTRTVLYINSLAGKDLALFVSGSGLRVSYALCMQGGGLVGLVGVASLARTVRALSRHEMRAAHPI